MAILIDGSDADAIRQAKSFLESSKEIAIDTETTGLDPYQSRILLISIGNEHKQFVFDVAKLDLEKLSFLKDALENPKILKLLQNAKFDYKMLKQDLGIVLDNIYDTMIVEQILSRGIRGREYGLDAIVEKYLSIDLSKDIRKTFLSMEFGDTPTTEQIEYAATDVQYLSKIRTLQLKRVKKLKLERVVVLENQAIAPTGDIELNGIYLDKKAWIELAEFAIEEREKAEAELDKHFIPIVGVDLLGHADINYNSPLQLQVALNRLLAPKVLKSTKEEYLKTISHPAISALLEYREKQKRITTYGADFLKYVHPITERIHSDFLQVIGTDSGRYSSRDPNLQNIPAVATYRAAFTAQYPDWKIVGADYSGMELRLLAELSMDPIFLDIFDKGQDAHGVVGSLVFGKPIRAKGTNGPNDPGENVDLRRKAKTLNFGICYGMGPTRLAAATEMSFDEAKKVIMTFWSKFPAVKKFFDDIVQQMLDEKERFAISPLDGRIRWLTDFDMDAVKDKAHAANIAKNYPLQGGNASILKAALVMLREQIKGKKIKIICTIHDEILLEAHESCADDAKNILETCMINAANLYVKRVPIKVESYIANCWKK